VRDGSGVKGQRSHGCAQGWREKESFHWFVETCHSERSLRSEQSPIFSGKNASGAEARKGILRLMICNAEAVAAKSCALLLLLMRLTVGVVNLGIESHCITLVEQFDELPGQVFPSAPNEHVAAHGEAALAPPRERVEGALFFVALEASFRLSVLFLVQRRRGQFAWSHESAMKPHLSMPRTASQPIWKRCATLLLPLGLSCLRADAGAAREEHESAKELIIEVKQSAERQVIDGFGGSLAFWGFDASEEALRYAFEDLGATIVRVPGEVPMSGAPDEYRAALQRVTRLAPQAKVLLCFWQPRSSARPKVSDWLDDLGEKGYALKPSMRAAWADEIVSRIRTIRQDWGANVKVVSVQNEPNFSVPGSPTCRWEPQALAEFISDWLAPRLKKADLAVELAAPDLAYVGNDAAEAKRFHRVSAAREVSIFSYHMYDSYRDGEAPMGLAAMRARHEALGRYLRDELPGKRVWMTETTGAQWNSKEWHTLGWRPKMDEHDKALAAARYLHAALVDAQSSAFLWWGLTYSLPPPAVTGEQSQKFRDEGLILVGREKKEGAAPYAERTPKYYAFKQFSRFVRPGWVRLEVKAHPTLLVAAFRSPDRGQVAVIVINSEKAPRDIEPRLVGDARYRLAEVYVTDREHQCAAAPWTGSVSGESVTTLTWQVE
jgi:glucuronoarabinoxylan endo-1,4-beta-xylanase